MKYENTGSIFGRQNQRLVIEENNRLREALKFYAEEENWYYELNSDVLQDSGDIARKALEDSQ